jgi:hypothetical protein
VNDERWIELTERIRDTFRVTLDVERPLDPGPGRIEELEFESPRGRMRLERITRPLVLDRKSLFSKRAGSQTTEEYVYSEDEFSYRVTFFRWVEGAWQEEDFRSMMGPGRSG